MLRSRDIETWSFTYHDSTEAFIGSREVTGAHSISYKGQQLDFLVADRGASTTIVSFHGAVPTNVPTYPRFEGRGVAQRANVNLIGVADPSIAMGINLGWHLGNKVVGPLRPVISPLIRHILEVLDSRRTILLGGSGGGFAAAHFAHDFPGSIAFLFNPRLSLNRLPRGSIRSYLEVCHDSPGETKIPEQHERGFLRPYGPTDIGDITTNSLNHHLLIYQNLGDKNFLQTQLLPFLLNKDIDERVRIRFSLDGEGHVYIPRKHITSIVSTLSKDQPIQDLIKESKFLDPRTAMVEQLMKYPDMCKQ